MIEFIKSLAFTTQDGVFVAWELIFACSTIVFLTLWLKGIVKTKK